MKIDAHAHGLHAEKNEEGKRVPPLTSSWRNTNITPEEHIREHKKRGVKQALVLDPPEIAFELKELFGDFVLPCPLVKMDECSPEEIDSLLTRGACGIKFIAPMRPYGDDLYLPIYEVIRDHKALAVFHTGYLTHDFFNPTGVMSRPHWVNMLHMRPTELDRVNRALPDLKILLAHFGNPWWEEVCCMVKNKNIYADLSGGTAYKKSMDMWKELFAPNGVLDIKIVSKLCYGSDDSIFFPEYFGYQPFIDFYENLYDALDLPREIREKIDHENMTTLVNKS